MCNPECASNGHQDHLFGRHREAKDEDKIEAMVNGEDWKEPLLEKDDKAKAQTKERIRWTPYVLATGALVLTVHSVIYLRSCLADHTFELNSVPKAEAAMFVWSSAWMSAVCSGLGVVPFLLVKEISESWLACSNAIAAGVMIAASIGLIADGVFEERTESGSPIYSLIVGFWLGILFIKATEYLVEDHEPSHLANPEAKKSFARVLVVMAAMTVHSFSEGVGIGVSHRSQALGGVVSTSLAIHNIPEGLACAIVLIPRGFSKLSTTLWCIFSSLPQPLLAVPAFLLVDLFEFITPVGCAFAAGAMSYVSVFELLKEAHENMSVVKANGIAFLSMLMMGLAQVFVHSFGQ